MEIDLDELLVLAGKVPRGPWKIQHPHAGLRGFEVADRTGLEQIADRVTLERAQYIAAANPAVVAELVRRVKAAEQDAARYRFLRTKYFAFATPDHAFNNTHLLFSVPGNTRASVNCDETVNSAMATVASSAP